MPVAEGRRNPCAEAGTGVRCSHRSPPAPSEAHAPWSGRSRVECEPWNLCRGHGIDTRDDRGDVARAVRRTAPGGGDRGAARQIPRGTSGAAPAWPGSGARARWTPRGDPACGEPGQSCGQPRDGGCGPGVSLSTGPFFHPESMVCGWDRREWRVHRACRNWGQCGPRPRGTCGSTGAAGTHGGPPVTVVAWGKRSGAPWRGRRPPCSGWCLRGQGPPH